MNSSQVFEEDYVSELAQERALGRQRQRRCLLTYWQTPASTQPGPGSGAGNSDPDGGQQSTWPVSVLAVTVHLYPSSTHIPSPFPAPSFLFLTVLIHPQCTSALDSRLAGPVEVGDVFTSPPGDSGS